MRKFLSLLYKDYLLLVRDVAGLCLMYVMPVALVLLMTFLQNNLIGSISESKISVLMLNQDLDSLGNAIEKQITVSENFIVEKATISADDLKNKVACGDYMIGIVIPSGTSESIRQNTKNSVLCGFNGETVTMADSAAINIYLDPTLKTSFRNTLMSTLNEFAAKTECDFLLQELMRELNKRVPFKLGNFHLDNNQVVFDVRYALMDKNAIIPNATQHNVPAWTLFAIFFIVLSFSGSLIKEREDGSFKRLLIMPCSYSQYLLSKSVVYLTVCLLQLVLLFALGVYLFPHIGLPKLTLAANAWLLLPMGVCSSLAAMGFGMLIGKITNEYQQASVFAALSVIIFAAIGGIWVPVFAMPEVMQTISHISPLNWGLNGFYDILIRAGGLVDILQECLLLLAFAALCMAVAVVYHRRKKF
jgi:ABC-2 type transport system permease protein